MGSWMDYAMEKLKEIMIILESLTGSLITEPDKVFPPGKGEETINRWMDYVTEKLKEIMIIMENLTGSLITEFDKVFPPGTREETINRWIHMALPYIALGLVLVLFVWCCRCCCSCGNRRRSVRMMNAPGRNYRMPREPFENDPRSYFRALRGRNIDKLV